MASAVNRAALNNFDSAVMKKNKQEELTIDQLKERLVILKSVTWALAGMLLVLFCITTYLSITAGKMQVLSVVPLALSSILFLNFMNIKRLNSELRARQ